MNMHNISFNNEESGFESLCHGPDRMRQFSFPIYMMFFGEMRIKIEWGDGSVRCQLLTFNPEIEAFIKEHLSELRCILSKKSDEFSISCETISDRYTHYTHNGLIDMKV